MPVGITLTPRQTITRGKDEQLEKSSTHMNERNDEARAELDGEMAKFGLKPAEAPTNPNKEGKAEVTDEPPKEPTKEVEPPKEPETPKERVERKPEEPAKEPEGEKKPDEGKKEPTRPTKYIPIPQYQAEKEKHREREAELLKTIEDLKKGETPKTKESIEDDIQAEIKAFAEESGIEDEAVVAKLITLASKPTLKMMEELKKQVDELKNPKPAEKTTEQLRAEENARFEQEWNNFNLDKVLPGLSQEQKEEAKRVMDELSHTKDWHKYELDYIFFKNKQDFEDAVGTKRFKGSGPTQTQGVSTMKTKTTTERPTLPSNPTAQDIKTYENYMASILNEGQLSQKPAETL